MQIKIEGFDPDKFKAANNQGQGSGINIRASNLYNNNTTTTLTNHVPSLAQPPGFVTYDNSEQQLLASLERELGV